MAQKKRVVVILVVGASGQQGGAVAHSLLKRNLSVRLLTRTPEKCKDLGAEVAQGDLKDISSIEKALEGIKRAYLVTTWYEEGVDAEIQQGINFINAAKKANLEHLVFGSVITADRITGVPHFDSKFLLEKHVRESGIPYTIFRPVFFMENFSAGWLNATRKNSTFVVPIHPNTKLNMIALENIGDFVAEAFMNPSKFIGKEIDLASDELTMPEAIQKIADATGKPLSFEEMPEDQAEEKMGKELAIMFRFFNEKGFHVDIAALKKYGIPLTSFEEHLKKAAWVKNV